MVGDQRTADDGSGCHRMIQIYVPGIGQYDNIGDIVLRRRLLRWLAPLGRLHVFVGNAPAGYAESLDLGGDHVFYRSFASWYRAGMADALKGRAAYVFKPGEIQITFPGLKEHVSLLPLLLALRLRSQPVIRVGAGARGFEPIPRMLMRPSLALSDLVLWRDKRTRDYLGTGEVMPDLAFAEGPPMPRGSEQRPLLTVSMRSDRPEPSDAWVDAIRTFAQAAGLEVVTIVQVERDAERSRVLAERLGARFDPWPGADHQGHEEHLRSIYRQTSVAVSDRLHVLITALTEGAAPAALLVDESDKIARHFDAAGITSVAVPTAGMDALALTKVLEDTARAWPRFEGQLAAAREALESVRLRVASVLTGTAPRRATAETSAAVWHVGRRGEVAGGMTQVVNAYLAWPFTQVRQRLLVSRNGSAGPRALWLFARAMLRTPFLGMRRRTVVAVHLSQGGSFVREGALLRWAALCRYPVVAHLHGSEFVDYARREPTRVRRTLAAADLIVTLSEATRAEVATMLPDARVELVPNAVPEGSPAPKENIVVFGGSVTRRKGVDVLLEAWRRADPPANWSLHLAGPVLEDDLVAALPVGVHQRGGMPHEDLMRLLERSRIAALPSRDEAMPMFVLEALARHNAVVSTTVGGIPAVLGDGAGVLVGPGDVDALADELRRLMHDDEARAATAAAGYDRFVAEFAADAIYPRVEQLWLSTLSEQDPVSA